MKTTIVNTTPYDLEVQEGYAGAFRFPTRIPSMQECIWHVERNSTYREIRLSGANEHVCFGTDDLWEAAEIRVYETPTQLLEWRVSKMRGSAYEQEERNVTDSTAFDAVIRDASSRMKIIEKSQARLVMLSEQVKICPAQCHNLVQTCLCGVKKMRAGYNEKSEDDMWQLYSSKKLGQLTSSLDKLLSTLGSIQDLLQACGSNWGSMALVVSLPLPPPEKVYSKFDILIKELHWNFETIDYALCLNRGLEFVWHDRKFRYVLERIAPLAAPEGTVAEDMELKQSGGRASEDRCFQVGLEG